MKTHHKWGKHNKTGSQSPYYCPFRKNNQAIGKNCYSIYGELGTICRVLARNKNNNNESNKK